MKKLVSLLAAAALILALFAACTPSDDPNATPKPGSSNAPGGYVYVPEYIDLPGEIMETNYAKIIGDVIYFFQTMQVGEYTVEPDGDTPSRPITPRSDLYEKYAPAVSESASDSVDADTAEPTDTEPDTDDETAPAATAAPTVNVAAPAAVDRVMPAPEPMPAPTDGGVVDGPYTVPIYEQRLFKMNTDGTGFAQIENFEFPPLPEEAQQGNSYYINSFLPADDGSAWVVFSGYFGYYDEEAQQYVDNTKNHVRRIDLNTGAVLTELEMSPIYKNDPSGSVGNLLTDGSGNLIMTGWDSTSPTGGTIIYVFAPDGTLSFTCTIDGQNTWLNQMVPLPGGKIGAMIYDGNDSKTIVKPLDMTAKGFGEALGTFPSNVWNIMGISADGKSIIANMESGLASFEPGKAETTELVNWIDSDIDSNSMSVVGFDSKDNLILFDYSGQRTGGEIGPLTATNTDASATPPAKSQISLVIMKKTPASEVKQKTVITLAVNYLDYNLRAPIFEFNKKDPEYRIKVIDYSKYNTDGDYYAGITKLNTEIISGNVPDLILLNQLPSEIYETRGLLADLNPFLDADTELGGHDALLPELRNVLEDGDGHLTKIASGFNVNTAIGNADIVGATPGWTTEEMMRVKESAPADSYMFSQYMVRSDLINTLLYYNLAEYVDWESGKTYFDSSDFVNLLELVKSFPEAYDWENMEYKWSDEQQDMLNGKSIAQTLYLYRFDDVMRWSALLKDKMVYKGYPCASRKGSSLQLSAPIAMTVKCKNQEGAWRFLREILSEEFQVQGWNFPTNKSAFDKLIKEAMTNEVVDFPYENWYGDDVKIITSPELFPAYTDNKDGSFTNSEGKTLVPKGSVYMSDENGMTTTIIPYYAMSQSTLDKFMELLKSIDRTGEQNNSINDIINEELGPFFSGQKTAQETASLIQNRVKIYVNEQR
ncbi:MAG: hypothetical protein LBC38_05550 [Oscillospiraceae bacterium]|jgi:hypothetical protein|nr:hypothetical protein [Oscillospiraceae bacterium]